ncbi:protein IMPACT isoform X2 [Cottoperca gobio]|uniref:Protein IMPACT isoform X2 n=1 Tax=Cottoperca gobio TaxID=56716 RepID=A0A6J2PFF6_COTGO|nr:protein IMPACT isoform X2 [Cottoperca gobio]
MDDILNPENEGDLQDQIEEVEALSSIYGDEWCVIDEASRIFCIKISNDLEEPQLTACLQTILPPDYPSAAPPIYQINAAWLRGLERTKLANSLEDLYVQHVGESILYLWVEKIREFLVEKSQSSETVDQPEKVNMTAEEDVDEEEEDIPDYRTLKLNTENAHMFMHHENGEEVPLIKHGSTITDRRSTFQPHLAPLVTPRQVKMVLEKLYENKKIASATHNIYAYRFWTCIMSWWSCLDGMEVFCWVLTASNTSTTVLETSWWRKDTLPPRMTPPNLERRPKGQKARRQNEFQRKKRRLLFKHISSPVKRPVQMCLNRDKQEFLGLTNNLFKMTMLLNIFKQP